MNRKPDQIKRIKRALSNGRMIYDTGRKIGTSPIFESLSEDGRKLNGLEPLDNLLPNWRELLPTKAERIWNYNQGIKAKQNREGKN
jgi:hypothetical protein